MQIFFQQLRRDNRKKLLYSFLMVTAVAFFVMSINLYQNSRQNIRHADDVSLRVTTCGIILACYTIGAALAVLLTVRVNVMEILRDKE